MPSPPSRLLAPLLAWDSQNLVGTWWQCSPDCSNAATLTSVPCQLLQTIIAFATGFADTAQSHGCWLPEQEL